MSCSRYRVLLATPLSHRPPLNMSDPLFDALLASDPYTTTALPAPLQPSRANSPFGNYSNTSTTPFRPPTSNNQAKNSEAERIADEAEALFDPLQGEQHGHCVGELISLLYFPLHRPWCFAGSTRSPTWGTSASTLSYQRSCDAYRIMAHPEDVRSLCIEVAPLADLPRPGT